MGNDSAPLVSGKGWQIGFWLALVVSIGWLCVALLSWPGAIRPGPFINQGVPVTEVLPQLFLIIQPPVVTWLIVKALRGRKRRYGWRLIASASVPLLGFFVFVFLVEFAEYHRRHQEFVLREPGTKIRTNYICERNHKAVDFHRNMMERVDLKLTSIVVVGAKKLWLIQEPGQAIRYARTFSYDTGSIGGSEGIKWVDAGGVTRTAAISFSDIHDRLGPASIWIEMPPSSLTQPAEEWHPTFTCGPTDQTVTPGEG